MKYYINLFALALLFVFGCQNETTSPTTQGGKNTASQNEPTLSVTFNHSPATINESVTVTGSVAEDVTGTTAKVQLFQAFDSDPSHNTNAAPVSCDYSGTITWVRVAQSDNGVGSVSYTWTPTATGHYGFRVHYVKGNSENDNLIGACTNLEVNSNTSCDPTVTTSLEIWQPGYEGVYGTIYRITWTVCACNEELTDVKLAGQFLGVVEDLSIYGLSNWPGVYFDDAPDEYDGPAEPQGIWNTSVPVNVAWNISSIAADGCVTRTAYIVTYPYTGGGRTIADDWYLEFDTPNQSGRRIELDPVVDSR